VSPNVCPSCERELAKDMMFCPYCGSKIVPESASVEAQGEDKVSGVIPLAIAREGILEGKMFTLVLTTSRMIIARVTEADADRVRKASGSILMGGAVLEPERHRKALGAYSRRYLTSKPDEILAESEGNESIKLSEMNGIRIAAEEDAEERQFYLLTMDTARGRKVFQIPNDKDSRDLLISTFGEKVHW
jgi:hypothetical protein